MRITMAFHEKLQLKAKVTRVIRNFALGSWVILVGHWSTRFYLKPSSKLKTPNLSLLRTDDMIKFFRRRRCLSVSIAWQYITAYFYHNVSLSILAYETCIVSSNVILRAVRFSLRCIYSLLCGHKPCHWYAHSINWNKLNQAWQIPSNFSENGCERP